MEGLANSSIEDKKNFSEGKLWGEICRPWPESEYSFLLSLATGKEGWFI
jgi:hypothetical protein